MEIDEVVEARQQIINGVNRNQKKNAEMMITRTTRKLKEHLAILKVGDFITVVVPKEDR